MKLRGKYVPREPKTTGNFLGQNSSKSFLIRSSKFARPRETRQQEQKKKMRRWVKRAEEEKSRLVGEFKERRKAKKRAKWVETAATGTKVKELDWSSKPRLEDLRLEGETDMARGAGENSPN